MRRNRPDTSGRPPRAGVSRSADRTRSMVAAALVAALMAALGPLSLPFGPVPVTLQTFGVALAALLLAPSWAVAAMALYVALGAAGLPVFSKAAGGLAVVAGPTGGYLIGFVVGAGLAALARTRLRGRHPGGLGADISAGAVLLAVVYATGTVWLARSLGVSVAQAAAVGVVPFVAGDVVKVGVAIAIAQGVRRAGVRT